MNIKTNILIIGAGLAGSEAANYLATIGYNIFLVENKFNQLNPSQKIPECAELVCTNSLKSKDIDSAHGQLKYEMKLFDSLIIKCAEKWSVPAGNALAVDREKFASEITQSLLKHKNITLLKEEVRDPTEFAKKLNCTYTIIATGPLTLKPLQDWLMSNLSPDNLYFYDAIAPVVEADSLDLEKLYFKDRYADDNDQADYLNCPLNKSEYLQFVEELVQSEKVPSHNFEKEQFFESCLPIDLMAERGVDTPRFSCMKPVGLEVDGVRPYACVQLRKENLLGSAYNLVGFQTRMTYKDQLRVFKTLPGFKNANFLHMGSVHRNTFLNGRALFNNDFSLKSDPNTFIAGQISGVEGYTESASIGLFTAIQIDRKIKDKQMAEFPVETAIGALVNYVLTCTKPSPSNINLGLFPEVEMDYKKVKRKDKKRVKRKIAFDRAKDFINKFVKTL